MRDGDEPCPECGGSGEIEAGYDRRNGHWELRTYRCPNCDGTGYLDVPSNGQRRAQMMEVD